MRQIVLIGVLEHIRVIIFANSPAIASFNWQQHILCLLVQCQYQYAIARTQLPEQKWQHCTTVILAIRRRLLGNTPCH